METLLAVIANCVVTEIFHMIYGWACIVAFYGNKQQYVDFKDGNYVVAREINNPFKYMLSVICCQF